MTWEKGIDIQNISEIICGSHVFLGVGAVAKMDFIAGQLAKRNINSVLVMTGRGAYEKTGAWAHVTRALDAHDIKYTLYNKVRSNPETHEVDEAAALGKQVKAGAVIAIGGGSPIDAGKSAAVLLEYPDKTCEDLFELRFVPERAVPIIVINLTHGTGSEANRFAVVTVPERNYKPAIAYDCLYPWYSIDDPALMTGLPANQTIYVSVDAVNHVIESSTTRLNDPFSITTGKETVQLVAHYLPLALKDPQNLEARYFLAYAAMIAGISFNNGMLHLTHALEHPLSGMKPELTHGLGLAVLLPAVIKQIYASKAAILADILAPIVPGLKGTPDETLKAAEGVRKWLQSVGITETLKDVGFTENDVPELVDLVFKTPGLDGMLAVAPVDESPDVVRAIYAESL